MRGIPGRLRRLFVRDQGAQIAEFAAVVPMLVMMIFGILWFGRAFNVYATVNQAAQAAARAGSAPTCATCAGANTLPDDTTVKTAIVDPIFRAAHLDPSSPPLDFTLKHHQPLDPGNTIFGTVVTLSYPYKLHFNKFVCCPASITPVTLDLTISAHAQVREEN